MKFGLTALLLAGLCSNLVQAAGDSCQHAMTQADMNVCAAKAHELADKQLNSLYQQYRQRLAADDQQRLTIAQRAWIGYRDAACRFETAQVSGGSIFPTIWLQCLTGKTENRIKELQKLLQCQEGDLDCPALQ
ncbi:MULTISPECIES: lysozyme inhibitor LprI family protein [Aquitalea]|uniref:Uncharacterized protein YecT (DUF1311 family) n=1 Tax=Aquitalea magnusonii TaxID=332411 RepID=A0A318K708_9NEIS|nr:MULTISPECIES: lysozyme inhibitor LprI family protein [Aquitalea]PXX49975.1 uncharacterized protein YecT (DUF1311 family) [Aquitalea magnusonii]